MNTMEKQARDKKERLRHLLLFFACTRHHRDEKYGGPPKGADRSDGIPPLFLFQEEKMIFRKEKEHGVLTEEEILDMARDIAENDPAYIIGSMLIKSVCDDTGLDEGAAFSMLLDGGGMPKGIAAISARAANDLMRLYEEGGIEGDIDSYLEDERFVKMLLEMPVKAALRLYAAECNADAAAKAEREKGAMDVMEKLAARRALPSPIKGNTPAAADTDYANMPTREFNLIKERLMRAASEGRRVSL